MRVFTSGIDMSSLMRHYQEKCYDSSCEQFLFISRKALLVKSIISELYAWGFGGFATPALFQYPHPITFQAQEFTAHLNSVVNLNSSTSLRCGLLTRIPFKC